MKTTKEHHEGVMRITRHNVQYAIVDHRIRTVLEGRRADPEAIKYYIQDTSDNQYEGIEPDLFTVEWARKLWEDFKLYVEECQSAEIEYIDYKLWLYAIG